MPSDTLGKIEILGLTEDNIIFKFHRSADPGEKARVVICRRNPEACWYDDYPEIIDDYRIENPFFEAEDKIIAS